jgi:protein-tyrosine phosphatase
MAEVVLNDRLARSGLGDQVEVTSAGTGGWHVGEPMDSRAAALLTSHGYDPSRHRGHQLAAEELAGYDLLLAMDSGNHADVLAMAESSSEAEETVDRIRMFRDFDPAVDRAPSGAAAGDRDVPDPYYDDNGFRTVLAMVERVVDALVAALPGVLAAAGRTL